MDRNTVDATFMLKSIRTWRLYNFARNHCENQQMAVAKALGKLAVYCEALSIYYRNLTKESYKPVEKKDSRTCVNKITTSE